MSQHVFKTKGAGDNDIYELEIQTVDKVNTRRNKKKGLCGNIRTICCTFKLERQEELLERYFQTTKPPKKKRVKVKSNH